MINYQLTVEGRIALTALRKMYQFDKLGNKEDPMDELIYILISNRTGTNTARKVFDNLQRHCLLWKKDNPWDLLRHFDQKPLEELLRPAGFASQRATNIRQVARVLYERFGRVSLDSLKGMNYYRAYAELKTLPGVGVKTAKCVLGYSLGHDVMPLDVHCLRVMTRLGLLKFPIPKGENLHDLAEEPWPDGDLLEAHVLMVKHGRTRCLPNKPKCGNCTLYDICEYPNKAPRAKRR